MVRHPEYPAPHFERVLFMTNALIRPAWTPVTIAMMIIGFMIFWPLGLAMLAYILWGDRLDKFKSGQCSTVFVLFREITFYR